MWASSNVQAQQASVKTLGLTSAISLNGPTASDIKRTEELKSALLPFDVFESDSELNHRMEVLGKLNQLVKEWIIDISINQRNMPRNVAERVGGKIYTFGSYRLGVHQKGADIDALCVAPRHIDRNDYFTSFSEILKAQPEVTELRSVEDAFVPVIKMNFGGIEIDLLFARLALKEVPEDMDLRDDNLLRNLDTKCVRSMNGCRDTDEILRLVPNIENYRLTLRTIKLWAKRRGIYKNALGYLGGISWAILVARTCQLYPNAVPATLVHKFFLIFSQWIWPQPVLLRSPVKNSQLTYPIWDPTKVSADRFHVMPIITPSYPQQNSTVNVSNSTRTVMVGEFQDGLVVTEQILLGKCNWDKLFDPPLFFTKYKHFVVLLVRATNQKDHLEWCGLVQSKIRHLVLALERQPHLKLAVVNTEEFEYRHHPIDSTSPCTMWFIGLTFGNVEFLNLDLTEDITTFQDNLLHTARMNKIFRDGMSVEAKYVKKRGLPAYLSPSILKQEKERKIKYEASLPSLTNGSPGELFLKRKLSDDSGEQAKKRRSLDGNHIKGDESPTSAPFDESNSTFDDSNSGCRKEDDDIVVLPSIQHNEEKSST